LTNFNPWQITHIEAAQTYWHNFVGVLNGSKNPYSEPTRRSQVPGTALYWAFKEGRVMYDVSVELAELTSFD
jgi:hypothetical protein